MPAPIPDEVREAILTDIRAGVMSARAIARTHGVAASTVSKLAADAKVPEAFERSQTKNATRAQAADNDARRVEHQRRYLELVDHLLDKVHGSFTQVVVTPAGPTLVTLKEPPPGEIRNLVVSAATATDKDLALVRYQRDASQQGLEERKGLLVKAFEALAGHADEYVPMHTAEPDGSEPPTPTGEPS